jgi:hypothetical protein
MATSQQIQNLTVEEFCFLYSQSIINEETENINKNVNVVLSALDDVVSYYQKYGFEVVDYNFDSYPYLQNFEIYDDTKMYSICSFSKRTKKPLD